MVDIDRGLESLQFVRHQFPDIPDIVVPTGGVASFSPDDRWIASACRKQGLLVGHAIHINGILNPRPFENLPKDHLAVDPTYTPDGKHLIISLGGTH